MLWLAVSAAALIGGFVVTRDFVRRKLRFVDAIQKPAAPLIAGAAAAVVALPASPEGWRADARRLPRCLQAANRLSAPWQGPSLPDGRRQRAAPAPPRVRR